METKRSDAHNIHMRFVQGWFETVRMKPVSTCTTTLKPGATYHVLGEGSRIDGERGVSFSLLLLQTDCFALYSGPDGRLTNLVIDLD